MSFELHRTFQDANFGASAPDWQQLAGPGPGCHNLGYHCRLPIVLRPRAAPRGHSGRPLPGHRDRTTQAFAI